MRVCHDFVVSPAKSIIRAIGFLCLVSVALWANPAVAETFDAPGVKSVASKASGGLFQETPAGAALSQPGWDLTILRFEAAGAVSEAKYAYDVGREAADFKDRLKDDSENSDPAAVQRRVDDLKDLARKLHANVGLELSGQALRFTYGNAWLGRLSLGGYWEGAAGVRLAGPDPDKIQAKQQGNSFVISIGQETDVLKARAYGDTGGYLDYGRSFQLPHKLDLAAGARLRVFRRWLVPEHKITFAAELQGDNTITAPDEFNYLAGLGAGLDLSAVLALNDRWVDARVTAALRNAYARVWYEDYSMQDRLSPGLEVALRPLHVIGHDKLVAGIGVDRIGGDGAEVGLGALYQLGGDKLNITPRLGLVIGRPDLWQEKHDLFTAGFSARLYVLSLTGLYEQDFNGSYNAGVSLGFDI